MIQVIRWVTPFKKLTPQQEKLSTGILIVIIMTIWTSSGNAYIPSPLEIIKSVPRLVGAKDIINNFFHSIGTCFSAIFYSTLISLVFCYISVIPIFKPLCSFLRKFRFLPSAGLSFLFMKMTNSIDDQAMAIMVFGVTTWLLDSMLQISLSISDEETMYSKSLRLSSWEMMREILVYGKAAQLFTCIIANFAMAWMLLAAVENITKASGGLGVILSDSNKGFRMEEVYAIQLLILLTGIVIDYGLNTVKNWLFPYSVNK